MAFGDSDGWPAMGTFDIINLRQNGYDFHVGLMAGTEKWTDAETKAGLPDVEGAPPVLPGGCRGPDLAGRGAGARPEEGRACTCSGCSSPSSSRSAGAGDLDDLDFFPYPDFGTEFDAEKALDAPIDGFMLSPELADAGDDLDAAKAFLEYLAQPATQVIWVTQDPGIIAAAKDADINGYNALQKKAAELIGGAQRITQFLDRDTNPNFAGPNGMQAFLLDFIQNPDQDLDRLHARRSRTSGTRCSLSARGLVDSSRPWATVRPRTSPLPCRLDRCGRGRLPFRAGPAPLQPADRSGQARPGPDGRRSR